VLYVMLVSHGELALGLHSALKMIAGDRETVLSTSLKDGMGADVYAAAVEKLVAPVTAKDRIVLMADLIGGSPLTTAMKVLADKGLLAQAQAFGGMNLPMALTAVLTGESCEPSALPDLLLAESRNAMQQFALEPEEDQEI